MKMKNFALVGAAGYIAPRHMKAIQETGNNLSIAYDPFDSIGILDSYFPKANFFTEFERYDRHLDKVQSDGGEGKIDFVSICSPNYLHDSHIRHALRNGADAICEKPLVLNPWNIEHLNNIEKATGRKLNNILQLRLHSSIIELKAKIDAAPKDKKHEVDLSYITSRGQWYYYSWKGVTDKSGGVATNIGVHFFDMLGWIFGKVQDKEIHISTESTMAGFLEFENARVRWFLSIDSETLPKEIKEKGQRTFRSIKINNEELEFSGGFTDLHTKSYEQILKGNGFASEEAKQAIDIVYDIRSMQAKNSENCHPLCEKVNGYVKKVLLSSE
jgi:UDP-N-acetyl-2-amino-2-deoxyglucuronate dehydrogenase